MEKGVGPSLRGGGNVVVVSEGSEKKGLEPPHMDGTTKLR